MTEIKSTMEMVLARAEKMAAAAPQQEDRDDTIKTGMRLAAEFMDGKNDELTVELQRQPAEKQSAIREGIVQILLRNIVLPRDEKLRESSERALRALPTLGGDNNVVMLLDELAQIIGQYNQHKEQAGKQLSDAIKAQLQQQAMAQGIEPDQPIDPTRHPKYQEELTRMMADLNSQYNEAIDQRKERIALAFNLLPTGGR